jgi:hypothetical protein
MLKREDVKDAAEADGVNRLAPFSNSANSKKLHLHFWRFGRDSISLGDCEKNLPPAKVRRTE